MEEWKCPELVVLPADVPSDTKIECIINERIGWTMYHKPTQEETEGKESLRKAEKCLKIAKNSGIDNDELIENYASSLMYCPEGELDKMLKILKKVFEATVMLSYPFKIYKIIENTLNFYYLYNILSCRTKNQINIFNL